MSGYRLTPLAAEALREIYIYTHRSFGTYQAEAYLEGFRSSFGLLARFNEIGARADDIKEHWRRYRYQSHFIFYTIEANDILIRAIVHAARIPRSALIE